ncbi:alpha-ketoglutarate-dependent dioxygenase AlkB [Sphingobium sp. TCM1]|jgi:alkylated DNA repair dioxygenase AlkB|uniref:alpha-ketoglutarate-dependent dioxygenase AlkB n=1 Tax=Sphingobium sp. TCM1 TaxID=453246 RepID=UPI0007F514DA|nr:alpha-ketoglutarate-dependent dioxygenase AlkB [Sphingobium sp. TCM1]OAN55379.1 2OG-Fe(II) oxygenase [Sphingobium sp. TCM1]
MAEQIDLFAPSQIPGLRYAPDFLSRAEETELIERIATAPLLPFRFQRWTGKRLTHSYGWSYDFERGRFEAADPLPRWLLPIRDRAADFAGLSPDTLVQALLIRYDPGAGIGWHKDRPVFEHVVGLSLGAAAPMRFRRRNERGFARRSVSLEPRSIYHLAGEVRHEWEHSIAEQEEARWSITFRSLKPGR